jgi:DnaJ domain
MSYFLLGLVLLVGVLLVQQWFRTANTSVWKHRIGVTLGILLLAVSAGLFIRGAAAPASGLAMLALWLMSNSGGGLSGWSGAQKSPGQTSGLRTDYLDIALDHDSGDIHGEIRKGRFAGRTLDTLTPADLAALWDECRQHDPQSAQVVEAYLDQVYPDWRDQAGVDGGQGTGAGSQGGASGAGWPGAEAASMTREEAFDILGLKATASDDDVREAHRQLMLKLHPDKGGSTYFASKINQAKDVLLG